MRASDSHRGGRPVLPITESTLLWSMRAWVAGSRHSIEPERRIARVLARLGARDASEYLFGFMFALLHGAVRPMQVSCPCHPRVGADEQALLSVFALAQEDQSFEALLTLRGFVTPAAAEAAYRSAQGVVGALLRSGRWLAPPPSDAARRYGLVAQSQPTAPASTLIH